VPFVTLAVEYRSQVASVSSSQPERNGMRGIIEWYGGLSPWLRFGVAGAFLLLSVLVLLLLHEIWIWSWVVGIVLLLFAFPSGPEKKGYHDF
jgi:hypothetical protein